MLKKKKKYYYYKKKIGRPKKRGPKRKLKKRGRSWQQPWNFKLILCDFHKQKRVVGVFHDYQEAEKAKEVLLSRNSSIVYPKRCIVDNRTAKSTVDYVSEYVLLEKVRDTSGITVTEVQNEYGKSVPHITNNPKWKIADKYEHLEEETFWVYGYNPHTDRKTYTWIYSNFISEPIKDRNLLTIRIYQYYNKVVFRYDIEGIEFVVCKNDAEAIRLYNFIQTHVVKNKKTLFSGAIKNKSELGPLLINLIQEKTGWDIARIKRKNTL